MMVGNIMTANLSALAGDFSVLLTTHGDIRIETTGEEVGIEGIHKHYDNWDGFSFDAMPITW